MDPIATFLYVAGDKRLDHQVLLLAARDGVLTAVPGVLNKETWKDLSRGKISVTNVVENFTLTKSFIRLPSPPTGACWQGAWAAVRWSRL